GSEENTILFVFIFIIILVSSIIPQFRTLYNIKIVTRQFSLVTIVAMGQALVIITGGFDLSVGAIAALSGMSCSYFSVILNWPIAISVLFALAIGAICGVFNSILITKIKINALIATLASGWIFQGIILVTSKGWPISDFPENYTAIGQGQFLGITFPVIYMILIGIILTIFLSSSYTYL
ncbi:unnamed protein product, partial [marine sediment metagenome]